MSDPFANALGHGYHTDDACSPTVGKLVALSPEEVVIKPQPLEPVASVDVRIHFPRLGFVVRPTPSSKL